MVTKLQNRAGIDYAWNHPNPVDMVTDGITDVWRYISHDSSKDLTASELDSLLKVGLRVGVVFETTTTRPLDGYNAGKADAAYTLQHLATIGYKGTTAFWAADADLDPNSCVPYARGWHEVMQASGFKSGCYGGVCVTDLLFKLGLLEYAWQTMSDGFCGGANAHVSPLTAIKQTTRHDPALPGDYDLNDIYKEDCGTYKKGEDDFMATLTDAEKAKLLEACDVILNEVKRKPGSTTLYQAVTRVDETGKTQRFLDYLNAKIDQLLSKP